MYIVYMNTNFIQFFFVIIFFALYNPKFFILARPPQQEALKFFNISLDENYPHHIPKCSLDADHIIVCRAHVRT
jgi:hypothetical protein